MSEKIPKWFKKKYKRFCKLVKKRGISFFGLGMFPTNKQGFHDKEVHKLLSELIEYEPYLDFVREEVLGFE